MTMARHLWGRVRLPRLLRWGAMALPLAVVLAGCGPFGSTSASASDSLDLAKVPWCDRPLITFQDNSTTSGTVITKWDSVRDQLGFTVYLPPSLPKGSCLVLAGGSIHDPIFGGHMSITYQLPDTGALSFSEAPKRGNLGDKLQCTQSSLDSKDAICIGTIDNTTITLASRQSTSDLQQVFQSLKPNVNWVPVEKSQGTATPSPTGK